MKEYTIYFEFFGRKLRIKITASSEDEAKKILKDKMIFHKTEVSEKNETK